MKTIQLYNIEIIISLFLESKNNPKMNLDYLNEIFKMASRYSLKKLNVTTMTATVDFDMTTGEIDLPNVFNLLPTYSIEKKGKDLPHCDPGTIISLRYKGKYHGTVHGKCFKNSVSGDISVSDKNISIKISSKRIHMCGVTKIKQAQETADVILKATNDIQNGLDFIHRQDEKIVNEVAQWIIENSKSPKLWMHVYEDANGSSIVDSSGEIVSEINSMCRCPIIPESYDKVRNAIASFFLGFMGSGYEDNRKNYSHYRFLIEQMLRKDFNIIKDKKDNIPLKSHPPKKNYG
jgi:hypothetical protein